MKSYRKESNFNTKTRRAYIGITRISPIFIANAILLTIMLFSAACTAWKTEPFIRKRSENHSNTSATINIAVENPTKKTYSVKIDVVANWFTGNIMKDSTHSGHGEQTLLLSGKEKKDLTLTINNASNTNGRTYKSFKYSVSISFSEKEGE